MNARILIADDEPALRDTLEIGFAREGFETDTHADGASAWAAIASGVRYDLAVLDIGMPRLEGTAILSRLRAVGKALPVIFLTSRDEEIDRVAGLELGADDYVTKPFSMRELVARVRAVLRRYQAAPASGAREGERLVKAGCLELDPERFTASFRGRPLRLTVTEYRMLEALASSPGAARTRERLVADAWPEDASSGERAVDSHVKRLRRKLSEAGAAEDLVETVYGLGYRFDASKAGTP